MTPATYDTISEIYREETDEFVPPLETWEIEIVGRELHEDIGDIGGREPFVANARVRVTEPDGSTWEGLTRLE